MPPPRRLRRYGLTIRLPPWPDCAGECTVLSEGGAPALEHQRLDKWLWCARFASTRTACAGMAAGGLVRINRQPTDKPHARIRVGDVLTLPLYGGVRVVEVTALTDRRGSAPQAQTLYRAMPETTAPETLP